MGIYSKLIRNFGAKLDRPLCPFLLVILAPLVTVPITWGIFAYLPDCGADEPWWQLRHIQRALLPGLLNLLPFAWLASRKVPVRRMGAVAGMIGVVRVALPQVLVVIYATSSVGQPGNSSCTVSVFLLVWLVPIMLGVWVASTLLGGYALRRIARVSIR